MTLLACRKTECALQQQSCSLFPWKLLSVTCQW